MKTPDKNRKQAERDRMKAKGMKRFETWLHPDDWPAVRKCIDRLNRKRDSDKALGSRDAAK